MYKIDSKEVEYIGKILGITDAALVNKSYRYAALEI